MINQVVPKTCQVFYLSVRCDGVMLFVLYNLVVVLAYTQLRWEFENEVPSL